jgi:hypothetical protein
MSASAVRFTSFPLTLPPPGFVPEIIQLFRAHEAEISTTALEKGLESNEVLQVLRDGLRTLGFDVEKSKAKQDLLSRPVFYGENGQPSLQYQIDAFHPDWHCGLEIEAGRGWMGNAIYRDLIQAMVMVQVEHLCLAVCNTYKYKSNTKNMVSLDYKNAVSVAAALFGHTRVRIPYGLTIIGY